MILWLCPGWEIGQSTGCYGSGLPIYALTETSISEDYCECRGEELLVLELSGSWEALQLQELQ